MSIENYYTDVLLGIDGIVYARKEFYKMVTNCEDVIDEFRPINRLGEVEVPILKGLTWVDVDVLIGITTDGSVFSFKVRQSIQLESPVISAYPITSICPLLMVLLEDGRFRLIQLGDEYDLFYTISTDVIDRDMTRRYRLSCPIYGQLSIHSSTAKTDFYPDLYLTVTSDNDLIATYLYCGHGTGPDGYSITEATINHNGHRIDCGDIIKIRDGSILMNDGRIFSVRGRDIYDDVDHLILYQNCHDVNDVVDILPSTNDTMIMLTGGGEVWISEPNSPSRQIYSDDLAIVRPIELLRCHRIYDINQIRIVTTDIYIRGTNGGIYKIEMDGSIEDQGIPGQLLSHGRLSNMKNANTRL